MNQNIHIWTVQWVIADEELKYIPKVEIHKSYKSAMERIKNLVDFTFETKTDSLNRKEEKIIGLSMSEFII